MNKSSCHRRSQQAGFTLLEALIALLVMSFGMMALAGMQLSLSRSGDVAKQRTEAVRLAQQQMETLRSYASVAAWAALVGGMDTATTNTLYTRTWAIGGAATDTMRPVTVTVTWADRTSAVANQTISLASVISNTDPSDSGFLTFPLPQNTNLKRPKNRNINIPVPAITVAPGKSASQLAPGVTVVFDDINGSVVEKCTGTVNATSYAAGTAGCTVLNAYILAGYVSGSITTSGTSPFSPTLPTGINTDGITGWDSSGGKTISCIYTRATDQNNTSSVIAGYHYYLCVIPVTAGGTWSGTVRLGGLPVSSNYKVCRFQFGASTYLTANMRNVQPYVDVNESLDNQSYYIETSNSANCPTIDATSGTSVAASVSTIANGGELATTLHQDCRSSASPTTTLSGTCPLTTYNTLP